MDELVVFELDCGRCGRGFRVCRAEYRGQGYCSEDCRELEQAALRRMANARHQRTDEGRQDHAAHQRTSKARKNAEAEGGTDGGPAEVALHAEWSAPESPIPLAASAPEADGNTDADDLPGVDSPVDN